MTLMGEIGREIRKMSLPLKVSIACRLDLHESHPSPDFESWRAPGEKLPKLTKT